MRCGEWLLWINSPRIDVRLLHLLPHQRPEILLSVAVYVELKVGRGRDSSHCFPCLSIPNNEFSDRGVVITRFLPEDASAVISEKQDVEMSAVVIDEFLEALNTRVELVSIACHSPLLRAQFLYTPREPASESQSPTSTSQRFALPNSRDSHDLDRSRQNTPPPCRSK